MRRPISKKREWRKDEKYGSENLTRFMNTIMWSGKKEAAKKIVYDALDVIAKTGEDPLTVFENAIKNAGPLMEVRSRRVGGANYQVPREVRETRRIALAYRWIIGAARKGKGKSTGEKLASELMLAAKGEGEAVKKKDDVHKMAEANKAFAHFAW